MWNIEKEHKAQEKEGKCNVGECNFQPAVQVGQAGVRVLSSVSDYSW